MFNLKCAKGAIGTVIDLASFYMADNNRFNQGFTWGFCCLEIVA
jgi:hypothetical protein